MSSRNVAPVGMTLKLLQRSRLRAQARKASVWTTANVVKSPFKDVDIPNVTLYEYLWQNLDKWPQKTAAICGVTGRGYSYEQAFRMCNIFAANLRKKFKIRDGDTVSVMLPNIPDFPLVAMGILEAGGVISTINPVYTAHEVSRQLKMSDAKLVVTTPETTKVVQEALKMAKMNINIIAVRVNGEAIKEGTALFDELCEGIVDITCLQQVKRSSEDICFLPYSSGTTGLPKGVELTNRNLVANLQQISEFGVRTFNETTATNQDAVMAVLPFFHIYGASCIMFHKLSLGLKLVTLAKFTPDHYLKALEKHKANILFAVPPIIQLMTSHPAATARTFQHLEMIINGAAPASAADLERLIAKIQRQVDIRQGYGLSETSPVVSLPPHNSKRYATVGVPLPSTEVKIVDKDMHTLAPGQTGELLVRGPQVMKGYRKSPDKNNEVITKDGWFKTGDVAFVGADGYITISDRLKELIKVKGFQVPPAELEAVLREHPAVADAAVVGVPHPTNGEAPKAFVVLKEGQNTNDGNIKDFVKERVASFKRIQDVVFVGSIPKSASGKILKNELKEKYC